MTMTIIASNRFWLRKTITGCALLIGEIFEWNWQNDDRLNPMANGSSTIINSFDTMTNRNDHWPMLDLQSRLHQPGQISIEWFDEMECECILILSVLRFWFWFCLCLDLSAPMKCAISIFAHLIYFSSCLFLQLRMVIIILFHLSVCIQMSYNSAISTIRLFFSFLFLSLTLLVRVYIVWIRMFIWLISDTRQ